MKKQKTTQERLHGLMRENNFRNLGTESGESRSAATAVAPASLGADAHADHESVAGVGHERGLSLEEKAVQRTRRALLEKLSLAPWASRRRQELLELLDRMNPTIEELTAAVEREARKRPEVLRLMTHPGVGPLTALAYVLIIGLRLGFNGQADRHVRGDDSE